MDERTQTVPADPHDVQQLVNQVRTYVAHVKRMEAHRGALQTMQQQQGRLESEAIAKADALAQLEAFDLEVSGVRVTGGGGQRPVVVG